jgi:ABC-type multidrug transport system fused ATPase/permease subunit
MAVIPQDSFVFSGSLKFNIDPFSEHSEDQIMEILQKVQFFETLSENKESENALKVKKICKKLIFKKKTSTEINMVQFQTQETNNLTTKTNTNVSKQHLKFHIEDGGKNLSVGQKQLICIARALIKKPAILLMDEATSNIDEYTDSIIQNMIKEKFKDTTISKEERIFFVNF